MHDFEKTQNSTKICYEVDYKLLQKVEKLKLNGYKNEQKNIMNWLADLKITGNLEKIEKLKERILVKEDKPSNCYSFHKLLENLKNMPAEEVAEAIRGKPENLNCKTGFELIFEASTRFNCIKSFRDLLNEIEIQKKGYKDMIKEQPIILLNPTKPIHNEKLFKYNLQLCPKKPNKKND